MTPRCSCTIHQILVVKSKSKSTIAQYDKTMEQSGNISSFFLILGEGGGP